MMNRFKLPSAPFLKALTFSTALGLIVGCQNIKDIQNIDPLKDVVFRLNYQPAKTLIQGLVLDAKTELPLDIPISVSVFGPDASRIVTYDGVQTTTFKNEKGDISLGLKGIAPSEAKPAEIRIVVDAAGYIGSSQYLTILSAEPPTFEIRLVKEDTPPAGVAITKEVVETGNTGIVRTAETISTPIANSISTQVTVAIPAGTQLKDDKGQPVVGNLQASVAAYSSQNEASITAFPGGFETRVSRDNAGGTNTAGSFVTAGFTSIEITSSSGQRVSNFSQPVKVEMEVSPAVINPETNAPIKVGDKVPVFSYNENTGEWIYENDVTVKSQNGELQVELAVTHLSWYNLDWWSSRSSQNCSQGGKWNVTGVPAGKNFFWQLYVNNTLYKQGSNRAGDNVVGFLYPVPGAARLDIFSPNGVKIGSSTVNGICGTRAVAVNYPPELVNSTVVVRAYCENNKNFQVVQTGWVYYRKVGTSKFNYAYFQAGQGTLTSLEPNTNYEAGIMLDGYQFKVINSGNQTGTQVVEVVIKKNTEVCKNR